MKANKWRQWVVGSILIVALATTGCGLLPSGEETSETPDITAPAPVCTPPACAEGEVLTCPDNNCPGGCGYACTLAAPASDPELGPAPTDMTTLETWLADAWENEVNPAAVRAGLRASGWLDGYQGWTGIDMNGDFRDEWVIVLNEPDGAITAWGRIGNLWIVSADGIVFRAKESLPAEALIGEIAPEIVGLADMTNDGRPELVINQYVCGANTCYGNYSVISATNNSYNNIVDAEQTDPSIPDIDLINISYPDARFTDFERDGLVEFQVHGGALGSVGAGIVQTYTEFWAWDGTAVRLKDRFYDVSEYRHHYVYDANRAMEKLDYEQAIYLYEEAINNGNLVTPETASNTGEVYAAISQFSAARLVQIDLLQGDLGRAQARANWLQQNYGGTAISNATIELVTAMQSSAGNYEETCNSIETNLAEISQPFGPLTDQMGYGNPSIGAADFCP